MTVRYMLWLCTKKSALREAAEKELFVRNEDAAFAEFKADEAMKWLDAELAK